MEKISDELDYAVKINNHSTISWRDVAPQGSTSVNLSATGSVGPSEFLISPVVFNMAESRLEFRLSIGAGGNNPVNSNVIDADLMSVISRVVLYDSGTNALLVDINNFDKYNDMMKYAVCKKELNTKPYHGQVPQTSEANAKLKSVEDKQKSNSATANANRIYGRASDGRGSLSTGLDDITAKEPFDGILFTYVSAGNSACFFDVSIPLKAFKGTILSQDNLLYNPTNLVLQIYWNATNNFGGIVETANLDSALPSTALTSATISGLNLVLSTEANLEITSRIISKVMGDGLQFNAPYPSVVKHSVASSTAHAFTTQLTRAYGNRILYLMTAKYAKPTTNQINNHAIGAITRYNTTLNSVPMKYPRGFNVLESDDYILGNKQFIEGSVITNPDLYRQKWVHVDSFFGEKPLCDIDFNDIDGLDVSAQSSLFGWEATLSSAEEADYYVVILGHKVISFTSMGATIQ